MNEGFLTAQFPILALVAALALPPSGFAAGTVGSGTPASCSEAALDAALAGGGTVRFDCGPAPHVLAVTTTKTITADTVVDGGNLITLDGGHKARIFHFRSGTDSELRDLTIANGGDTDESVNAILNEGRLFVSHCTFTGNLGWNGGAFDNAGTLVIHGSRFDGNHTDISGFGFIPPSSIDNGGAIYNTGSATITGSTFTGSRARQGGAIYHAGVLLGIENSTFVGNRATWKGSAVLSAGQPVVINGTTFVDNLGGSALVAPANLTIRNSIIANNASNCDSPLIDAGHNLQYPGTGCGAGIPVADPMLGPLASHGGVTRTLAPLPGSPAIDAGNAASCAAADQRGWPRVDGDGSGGVRCDIGAHEFTPGVSPAFDVTGLWWNPEVSGLSLSLHQNPAGITFGVWYTYGGDHRDRWLTLQGDWVTPSTFAGTLYRTTGPAIGDASDPSQVSLFAVGTGVLSFSNAGNGSFTYTLEGVAGNQPIRRFEF